MRPIDRFESKVLKTESCWLWMASCDKNGYGRFRLGPNKVRAPRAAYEFYKGEIPLGLMVRHKCDTPRCVNPEHLELGTNLDNVRDRVDRGRNAVGEQITKNRRSYKGANSPASKITEEQALLIKADGRRHADIAADYGLTRAAVSHLKRGFTWSHLCQSGSSA